MLRRLNRVIVLCAATAAVFTAVGAVTVAASAATIPTRSATLAAAAVGNGGLADTNIQYVGRWDTSSTAGYIPNWTGGYLQTSFTGTTVKILLGSAVNIYVSVDGGADVFYAGVKGTVNLTPTALASGTHTLRVEYRSGDCVFKGLTFDSGAGTVNPNLTTKLVEFVGDSITAGYLTTKLAMSAYGWVLGEKLKVRHTQVARAGYCLVTISTCVGQGSQFFDLGSTGTTAWDFSKYAASTVVINLGTNDIGYGVTSAQFQTAYTTFLKNIRAKYPSATLFAMETFKQRYVAETRAAVAARVAAGDAKVAFINTEGWLTVGTDYVDTDGHPNDAGHVKVANKLAPIIAPAIGVAVP